MSFGVLLVGAVGRTASASTAAFAGTVVAVNKALAHPEAPAGFTVRIEYFDYISWGKFNKDSKIGETITRQIRRTGTVCILNGELTNAQTLAAAIEPGVWGYFYEDTWLDAFTLPDFRWGEVMAHDAARKQFTLRLHSTHKQIHLDANPPVDEMVAYDDGTTFRIEQKPSDAAASLAKGNWVQIHQPRKQTVAVRGPHSAYEPKAQVPHEQGKRGFANDLSCQAILKAYKCKDPTGVIDQPVEISVSRFLNGKWEDVTLNCRNTTLILDGKVCPVGIGARAGRHAVLCHYRSETTPHKIVVRSDDDAVRGTLQSVAQDAKSVVVAVTDAAGKTTERTVALEDDSEYQLDGRKVAAAEALKVGHAVAIHPRRGRAIIAMPPS